MLSLIAVAALAASPEPAPKYLPPALIAQMLPPLEAPDEPQMWYGPFDLRTASIA